jgi:hypothetical protein
MPLRFPHGDLNAFKVAKDRYYQGAAVCRRGHAASTELNPLQVIWQGAANCPTCGARVLVGCETCGLRIRGRYFIQGVWGSGNVAPEWERPSFCDECGSAHPWATREERIFELENILDQEGIDEADRVFIHDRLADLRDDGIDEKRERQLWTQIRQRSAAFLTSEPVQKIAVALITAQMRKDLGI